MRTASPSTTAAAAAATTTVDGGGGGSDHRHDNDSALVTTAAAAAMLYFFAGVAVGGGSAVLWHLYHRRPRKRTRRELSIECDDEDEYDDDDDEVASSGAEAHLWKIVEDGFTGALICCGDRLGLYDILSEMNRENDEGGGGRRRRRRPVSSHDVAERTGWNERWLREWLIQSAAAGICRLVLTTGEDGKDDGKEGDDEISARRHKFVLRGGYERYLVGPDRSDRSIAGMFPFLNLLIRRVGVTCRAIRTGAGVDYDHDAGNDRDENDDDDDTFTINRSIDRKNRNFFSNRMADDIFRRVRVPKSPVRGDGGGGGGDVAARTNGGDDDGEEEREQTIADMLSDGARNVADVGCGCGASTIAMASEFPRCKFYAYESSGESLRVLRERIRERGLTNITVRDVSKPNGSLIDEKTCEYFDLVYSHDVLHDMTDPKRLVRDVRSKLHPIRGCWIIIEVDCRKSMAENLTTFPPSYAALNYGFSCFLCLHSATCRTNGNNGKIGMGLGTMGLHEDLLRRWIVNEGGFRNMERIRIPSLPKNSCYVVT